MPLQPSNEAPTQGGTCDVCHYQYWLLELHPEFQRCILCWGETRDNLIANATSTEAACRGCQILFAALDFVVGEGNILQGDSWISTLAVRRRFFVAILFKPTPGNDSIKVNVEVDVFTLPGEASLPSMSILPELPATTNLEDNIESIKKMLSCCERDHQRCNSPTAFTPTRLLNVGSSNSIVYLVETAKQVAAQTAPPAPDFAFHQNARYACLSHCWGRTRSRHMLRHNNYWNNLRGIPIAELPTTFRDAIHITRTLGIDYLWIDSLCIIQDDHVDWRTHVKIMAEVYRSAYITLAAGASVDDDGGFFSSVDPKCTNSRTLTIGGDGMAPVDLHIRLRPQHPHHRSRSPISPLDHRGWTFQERLLSRRFLCFDKNEIQWECLEDVACTCSLTSSGFNSRHDASDCKPAFSYSWPKKWQITKLGDLDAKGIEKRWRNMVTLYSSKKLSFAKDKLPALEGLATAFAVASQDTYCYGHWHKNFQKQLLWGREPGRAPFGRPARIVPSWSWAAAADGSKIHWQSAQHYDHQVIEVVNIGERHVKLRGYVSVFRFEVIPQPRRRRPNPRFALRQRCSILQPSGQELEFLQSEHKSEESFGVNAPHDQSPSIVGGLETILDPDYKFWSNAHELQACIKNVYVLHFFRDQKKKGLLEFSEGLALWKTDAGTFERFALLSFSSPGEKVAFPHVRQHTITIV